MFTALNSLMCYYRQICHPQLGAEFRNLIPCQNFVQIKKHKTNSAKLVSKFCMNHKRIPFPVLRIASQ